MVAHVVPTIALLCFLGGRQPAPSLTRRARVRRSASPLAAFRDFDSFATQVRGHLATLNQTELSDPDWPSPLAYAELQQRGRIDLVEGCMQYGGFIDVSERLGGALPFCRLHPVSRPRGAARALLTRLALPALQSACATW